MICLPKDRIGKRMVEEAEKSGRIKPGDNIISSDTHYWVIL